jgi:RNA polymerase sigma-70 factor (ECF subfamily)
LDPGLDSRLAELMRRSQDGDRRAYETLLLEVAGLARAYLRKRAGQAGGLEDVVQETLLAIHRDRHTYDPARPFGPWMYAIARHRLLDHVRRQRRHAQNEVLGVEAWVAMNERPAVAEQGSRSGFLQHALGLLSGKQREIIRMLKLDGLTVAEIAGQTGYSESSIKVSAHRGYKHLRKLIGSACEE